MQNGEIVVLRVIVTDIDQTINHNNSKRKPFKIYCANETGVIHLLYFNYYPQYLLKWVKVGSELIVIGKVDSFNYINQIAHPEVINPIRSNNISIAKEDVIYPLTYGITNNQLQKYIKFVIDLLPDHEEWISSNIMREFSWTSFKDSLQKIHHPKDIVDINPFSSARKRIAYDELLATQLMVNLLRQYKNSQMGRSVVGCGNLLKDFISNLPFELTSGQLQAIEEITRDQVSPNKMSRLLQGDVGSGKTVVAFVAMLNCIESGAQAVLMAPTDILANQHFITAEKFLSKLPIRYAILTGKTKQKERNRIINELKNGEIQILFGTHAVFQEKIMFKDLALVVIDEQHRFGVEQRISLVNKGNKADLLIMSATPIPRSLSLALYGDMDITQISEKPKSRIAIKTSIIPITKINEVTSSLKNIIHKQGKIYWICPLVSESENEEKMAVETRLKELSKLYPNMVGMVHGQLDAKIKQENLDKFITGEYRILVATTVIEVGVDVPDATVIVIENAESFGLSQLHQLRGRVGRGDKPSNCILLYKSPMSNTSWQRLKILRDSDDGFVLAEKDLELRGGGDIIGTKQSGMPNFKAVDFIAHYKLIPLANNQAKRILSEDPMLESSYNHKYRELLYIFGFNYKGLSLMQ